MIAILMAVYNPCLDWFREQLISLNEQTHQNLKLYIRDDCSPDVSYEVIEEYVQKYITTIPYILQRNNENLGSNSTFELLTQEADGDYFAYCDQDDIWLPNKLDILIRALKKENAVLVCSDMYIIDGNGEQAADSITKVRRHHVFQSGTDLAPKMLVRNFVTGCTMLIRADIAKAAVPFCPYMVHDHYLGLYAAAHGKIVSLSDRLICYRIHDHNQTPVMAGVRDKNTYREKRIDLLCNRLVWLQEKFEDDALLSSYITEAETWSQARQAYFLGDKKKSTLILKYRKFGPAISFFELVAAAVPDKVFMFFVYLSQKNII